jgi:hypothetical protein
MAGEIANLAQEAPLLQEDYSHSEPGQRARKGKAKSKKRRQLGDRKRSRTAKKRRSPIADAMGARY